MSLSKVDVTKTLLDAQMSGSHGTGNALVGYFDKAATPFHPPEDWEWARAGTGWPVMKYRYCD